MLPINPVEVAVAGFYCERITEPLYESYRTQFLAEGVEGIVAWLASLRPDIRNLFAAHACWTDAGCGGFAAFFKSSHGALATEAVEGLRALGLSRSSAVVAEANRFFGPLVPRDHQIRLRLIEVGGVFVDGPVDRSLCRVGYREVARSPEWVYCREWDFTELDEMIWAAFEDEAPGGFLAVADRYAKRILDEPLSWRSAVQGNRAE